MTETLLESLKIKQQQSKTIDEEKVQIINRH